MTELDVQQQIKLLILIINCSCVFRCAKTDNVNNVMKNQTRDEFTVNSEMGDHRFKNTY